MKGSVGIFLIAVLLMIFVLCGSSPTIQKTPVSDNSTKQPETTSPLQDGQSSQLIFLSPFFVAILWPLAFVILEVTLSVLASTNVVKADGQRKYRVWHRETDDYVVETSPVDVSWIVQRAQNHQIEDIELLPPSPMRSFRIGIDLCVGALATDLATMPVVRRAVSIEEATGHATMIMSALLLHLVTASIVVLTLRTWGNDPSEQVRGRANFFANALGVIAIFTSFFILGKLITG